MTTKKTKSTKQDVIEATETVKDIAKVVSPNNAVAIEAIGQTAEIVEQIVPDKWYQKLGAFCGKLFGFGRKKK